MNESIKVGDVYRAVRKGGGPSQNYTVIRVTEDSYTYTSAFAINTVPFGNADPFPEPYFYKVYGV